MKKRISYGLALAAMATTLSALQAYADDTMTPGMAPVVTQSPQAYAPTRPDVTAMQPARNLGTISGSQMAAPVQGNAAPATAANSIPPGSPMYDDTMHPQQAGNITYLTGGIGDEERDALDAAKPNYNLYIMSANKDGTFIGDTRISIRDTKGNTVLDAPAGPLFYAKLPAGTYTVEASKNGQVKKDKLTVGARKGSNLHFSW